MLKKAPWRMSRGYDLRKDFKILRKVFIKEATREEKKRTGFPGLNLSNKTRNVIIKAISGDPFALPLDILLSPKQIDFFSAEVISLAKKRRVHLVIDDRQKDLLEILLQKTNRVENIFLYPLPAIYPQEHPLILLKTVFGSPEKALRNYRLSDLTEIVSVEDILQTQLISLAFWNERDKIWQQGIFNLSRKTFREFLPLFVRQFPGLKTKDCRLISGGLLKGKEHPDFNFLLTGKTNPLVIIPRGDKRDFLPNFQKHFRAAYTYSTNLYGEERTCINCGWCDDICPLELRVKDIYASIENSRLKEAYRLGLYDSIECGLCTYRCPAKIDLLTYIRKAKEITSFLINLPKFV